MAYTAATVIGLLVTEHNDILEDMGLTTSTETNPIIEAGISWGLRQADFSPASLDALVDADLASVGEDDIDEVLDYARYHILGYLIKNFPVVDVKIGHRQEEFSQLARRLIEMFDRKRTELRQLYSFGQGSLEAGTIDLDLIIDKDEDIINV